MTGKKFIQSIVAYTKYAKYLPNEQRRETRDETFERNMQMHITRYPHLEDEIKEAYKSVFSGEVCPSMRSLQYGGDAIFKHETRGYNCVYAPVDDTACFREFMYLLLCGCGLGYSVRRHHVSALPEFSARVDTDSYTESYVVQDSIEGWADAVDAIVEWAFYESPEPIFDYSLIRQAGSRLSSGVIAPGSTKLASCLEKIKSIFKTLEPGTKLTPLNVHDIICHIADCVVSGGIRRSALIVMFDWDEIDMLECKIGDWWVNNPQRGRANNSATIDRNLPEDEQKRRYDFIREYVERALDSGSGDPAIIFTSDVDENYGLNPCCEANLYYNFCCLAEIVGKNIKTQEQLNKLARDSGFISTLQAGYTNFKYLRPIWQYYTEKEALIGVGITGIVDGNVLNLDLKEAAEIVKQVNEETALKIGINKAHRTTVIKPAGTTTLFSESLGSGCHDAFSTSSYIRRMRIGKQEPIYQWLLTYTPSLVEDEAFDPEHTAVLSVPIRVKDGDVTHTTGGDPIKFLERVKHLYDNWILGGHNEGPGTQGTNNVSATVYVTKDDQEAVFDWLWENRHHYCGLSLLPKDNANYPQMPLEEVPEDVIDRLEKALVPFDPTQIFEDVDGTNFVSDSLACAGGSCAIV